MPPGRRGYSLYIGHSLQKWGYRFRLNSVGRNTAAAQYLTATWPPMHKIVKEIFMALTYCLLVSCVGTLLCCIIGTIHSPLALIKRSKIIFNSCIIRKWPNVCSESEKAHSLLTQKSGPRFKMDIYTANTQGTDIVCLVFCVLVLIFETVYNSTATL